MQLRHTKGVLPAKPGLGRVCALAWSPGDVQRLAIADHNRAVLICDEHGNEIDKFKTKSWDPAAKTKAYMVKGLAWAPDGVRLAVAQSEGSLFVYKLAHDPSEKKTIARFHENTSIDCVVWPNGRLNEVVFGLGDGKVRIANAVKAAKAATMYDAKSPTVAVAAKQDGSAIVSSHMDGTIWRFTFDDTGTSRDVAYAKIATHPCVPYALAWGETIIAAGPDMKVCFYDPVKGTMAQPIDFAPSGDTKEMQVAVVNPAGYCCAVGGWDKVYTFNYNARQQKWEEGDTRVVEHLGAITSLAWRHDGQTLAVGSMRGSVDLYETCLRKYRHKGKFEFVYVSHQNVLVRFIKGERAGHGLALRSQFGYEILRVSVFQDRYLVSHTPTTLLVGDVYEEKLAEVTWNSAGNEKFVFDNPGVCLVYNVGELSLIQYGVNEILGTVRTEHISPHLLSVRITEPPTTGKGAGPDARGKKVIAHLIDRETIRVLDLTTGMNIGMVHHSCKIDWLELSARCTKLLFRDKNRQLFVYDFQSSQPTTLLNFCSYVQWVPNSDVVVAQNRGDLCVWYSIDSPERVFTTPIKGDVELIERVDGQTKVKVDEGANVGYYYLDEALIGFGTAMEDGDYVKAAELLDLIAISPTTEAMWHTLAKTALEAEELVIAERAFAALGDCAMTHFLRQVNALAAEAADEQRRTLGNDTYNGYSHYTVRAKLALMNGNWKQAEQILVDQGHVEPAFRMWVSLRRPDKANELAQAKRMPDADEMRDEYLKKLEEDRREEEAAELHLKSHNYKAAISLFIRGGMPARAAAVVLDHGVDVGKEMLEPIAAALAKAKMFERAGIFFERLEFDERAIDMYRRGNAYRSAVKLAQRKFPELVTTLEDEWGEYCLTQAAHDQAANHFIEAGQFVKAINAFINARHWSAAIRTVDAQDPELESTKRFYRFIANHFENQRMYSEAEKHYKKAGEPSAAVRMYTRVQQWDNAHAVAKTCLTEDERNELYVQQAKQLEAQGHYKDAERLFLRTPRGCDLATNMYKNARKYDDLVRLIKQYRPELLQRTYEAIAKILKREGQLKQAEQYMIAGGDWKAAVNMYCAANMWEDAIRVAKRNGGTDAATLVVLAWAHQLKGEAAVRLLQKFGQVEKAIEFAIDARQFDHAKEVAHLAMKQKLPYVHLRHAMFLEDEGEFQKAEEEFVRANKPEEAVDMYIEEKNWADARRVADTYAPAAMASVFIAQAKVAVEMNDFTKAEEFLLKASRPDLLVKTYCDHKMWDKARKIAADHCPDKLAEIVQNVILTVNNPVEAGDMLLKEGANYAQAIEHYLRATSEHVPEQKALIAVWLKALSIAQNNAKDLLNQTLASVAEKLCELKEYKLAAQQYETNDRLRQAVDTFMRGGADPDLSEDESAPLWDEAQRIADEMSSEMSTMVTKSRREFFESVGDGDRAIAAGNIELALTLWARKHEWDKCMATARKQTKDTMLRYSAQYVQYLIENEKYYDAVKVVTQDGFHTNLVYMPIYQALFTGVVMDEDHDEEGAVVWFRDNAFKYIGSPDYELDLQKLRDNVKVWRDSILALGPSEQATFAERVFKVVYYQALAETHRDNGLPQMAAQCLLAVLHFMPPASADKAYFDAGMACKDVGWLGDAFVLLQRYLDIVEAAEDEDQTAADLDHDGSLSTKTNVPQIFPLPRDPCIPKVKEEDVREWVLSHSVESAADKELRMIKCPRCEEDHGSFTLACMDNSQPFEQCCVTGGPILTKASTVKCQNCSAPADRDEWNRHIEKAKLCPMCQNQQSPNYG